MSSRHITVNNKTLLYLHSRRWNAFFLLLFSAFITHVCFSLVLINDTWSKINPTNEICEQVKSTILPAPPCTVFEGDGFIVLGESGGYHVEKGVVEGGPVAFALTLFATVAIPAVVTWKTNQRTFSGTWRRTFFRWAHRSRGRRGALIQTILAFASLVTWFVWTGLSIDPDSWVSTLNPSLTDDQFISATRWLACSNVRFARIFLLDSLIQGSVVGSIIMQLISLFVHPSAPPSSIQWSMVLFWDIVHNVFVMWYLPAARFTPSMRPYSLYHLSGVVRAARVFMGVTVVFSRPDKGSELQKKVSQQQSDTDGEPSTPMEMWLGQRISQSVVRTLRRQPTLFQKAYYNPSTVYDLLLNQLVLWIKLLVFMSASAVLITAVEGWSCQYRIQPPFSPCDCFVDLREFRGALYFICITLLTVGYGDLSPRTGVGRAAVVCILIVGIYVLPLWVRTAIDQYNALLKETAKRKKQRAADKDSHKRYTTKLVEFATGGRKGGLWGGMSSDDDATEKAKKQMMEASKQNTATQMSAESPPLPHFHLPKPAIGDPKYSVLDGSFQSNASGTNTTSADEANATHKTKAVDTNTNANDTNGTNHTNTNDTSTNTNTNKLNEISPNPPNTLDHHPKVTFKTSNDPLPQPKTTVKPVNFVKSPDSFSKMRKEVAWLAADDDTPEPSRLHSNKPAPNETAGGGDANYFGSHEMLRRVMLKLHEQEAVIEENQHIIQTLVQVLVEGCGGLEAATRLLAGTGHAAPLQRYFTVQE